MLEEKTEGIVLRSQDFKERHRIITLFTHQGLISLIVSEHLAEKYPLALPHYPLLSWRVSCTAEATRTLLRFHDGTILDDHFNLRQSFSSLQVAGALANAILTSQMPGKPSPALFVLYKSYHKQVPCFNDPSQPARQFLPQTPQTRRAAHSHSPLHQLR